MVATPLHTVDVFCSSLIVQEFTGTVPRTVRQRVHHVRIHTELLRILRGAGGQQRGRRVFAAAKRDHCRLRRAAKRTAFPVHREDQVDRCHVHGRIRTDPEHVRQQTTLARHRHGRLRAPVARAAGLRQRTLVQQFPHSNRWVMEYRDSAPHYCNQIPLGHCTNPNSYPL